MKRAIITAAIVAVTAAAAFVAGRKAGVRHALDDSCIWTVDRYDPWNPSASEWNGYDQLIFIELDGELYEHGMYQG